MPAKPVITFVKYQAIRACLGTVLLMPKVKLATLVMPPNKNSAYFV